MVNFFGMVLDFIITRDWRRVSILLLPLILFLVVAIVAFTGSVMDRDSLAQRYLAAGQLELEDAGDNWAFDFVRGDRPDEESGSESKDLPRFTEAIFRKAQQLRSNDERVRYIIAAMLGRKGAMSHAMTIMRSMAPETSRGYLPAHAWIAYVMMGSGQLSGDQLESFRHHLDLAKEWEQVPPSLLAAQTKLALADRDTKQALEALQASAEREPQFEGELFRLAIRLENDRIAAETTEKAVPRLLALIEEGTATTDQRITLADMLFYKGELTAARGVLEEGLKNRKLKDEDAAKLRLALSELYRLRFVQTLKITDGSMNSDPRLLAEAMRIDPTNPKVAEQVAMLARMGGETPSDELIAQLNRFLAQGIATPVTHAWLGEAQLLRKDYAKAIDHFEKVVLRMPNNASALNNLGYAIAITDESRLDEALAHIDSAINYAPREAQFHDSRGYILDKMGRLKDAIVELELAVELKPGQIEFHKSLADMYARQGNAEMSQNHQDIVLRLEQRDAEAEKK